MSIMISRGGFLDDRTASQSWRPTFFCAFSTRLGTSREPRAFLKPMVDGMNVVCGGIEKNPFLKGLMTISQCEQSVAVAHRNIDSRGPSDLNTLQVGIKNGTLW